MSIQEQLDQLNQHCGSQTIYRTDLNNILYTEGVKDWAEIVAGYWAITEISLFFADLLEHEEFIHIVITSENNQATIIADDGNNNKLRSKNIEFTDLVEGHHRFYFIDKIILLPSEY